MEAVKKKERIRTHLPAGKSAGNMPGRAALTVPQVGTANTTRFAVQKDLKRGQLLED